MSEVKNSQQLAQSVAAGFGVSKLVGVATGLIVVGAALSVWLFSSDKHDFGFAWLWGFSFVWTIVMGALFLVALHHLSGAAWSTVIRRVAEMFASPIALIALLFLPILALCWLNKDSHLAPFHWLDYESDEILEKKAAYLNLPFFTVRGVVFFALWVLCARFFINKSIKQDINGPDIAGTASMRKWAGPFMIIFAFTCSFAAFDWLMSLAPHWFSTIYGVYVFAGMTLVALAVVTLSVVWLQARGRMGDGIVRPDHLYNLGALMFTFTCFWGYIWFSQFMLIWYGNIPEETIWFTKRGWGPDGADNNWLGVTVVLLFLRFVIPFFFLISRKTKTTPRLLVMASVLIIIGQVWDLYWLIMPQAEHYASSPAPAPQLFGPIVLMAGLLILMISRFLSSHRCVAVSDPLFDRSYRFELTI